MDNSAPRTAAGPDYPPDPMDNLWITPGPDRTGPPDVPAGPAGGGCAPWNARRGAARARRGGG